MKEKNNMKALKWIVLVTLILATVAGTVLGMQAATGDKAIVSYSSGDTNGDGKINAKDITRLKRYLAKDEGIELADIQIQLDANTVFKTMNSLKLLRD